VQRSAAGERIKLTRYNKTVAIVIPKRDLEALEDCENDKQTETQQPPARPRRTRAKAKQSA
jgi:antitoxin (DNA-binding transcriptional repressor) of toxin-antitoxin stability system